MSRILVYTSPARGHLYPLVPTLEELSRRGHHVAVRTLASEVGRVRALGFPAEATDPGIEALAHEDWKATSAPAALLAGCSGGIVGRPAEPGAISRPVTPPATSQPPVRQPTPATPMAAAISRVMNQLRMASVIIVVPQ